MPGSSVVTRTYLRPSSARRLLPRWTTYALLAAYDAKPGKTTLPATEAVLTRSETPRAAAEATSLVDERGDDRIQRGHVEIDLTPGVRAVEILGGGWQHDAGVVDDDAGGTELVLDRRGSGSERFRVGHVDAVRGRACAGRLELADDRFEPLDASRHQRDGRARRCQSARGLGADPARRAGDHGDPAAQVDRGAATRHVRTFRASRWLA